ncbi:MAG: hypothetical protein N2170_09855 [Bacteroidia bacterium]|nr:hypothetical protein [Bacteroidia bacterium]
MVSKKLSRWLYNPYLWVTVGALLWLGFLDSYNWLEQRRLARRIHQMRMQLSFYEREIASLREEEKALQKDSYTQEYHARRYYWVKRPTEKLYILQKTRGKE